MANCGYDSKWLNNLPVRCTFSRTTMFVPQSPSNMWNLHDAQHNSTNHSVFHCTARKRHFETQGIWQSISHKSPRRRTILLPRPVRRRLTDRNLPITADSLELSVSEIHHTFQANLALVSKQAQIQDFFSGGTNPKKRRFDLEVGNLVTPICMLSSSQREQEARLK